jgi:beta-galactosidase
VPVQFEVSGAGKIVGVANADPKDASSMKQPVKKAYKGKCLVVVQPNGNAGTITLKAKVAGVQSSAINIVVK